MSNMQVLWQMPFIQFKSSSPRGYVERAARVRINFSVLATGSVR